VTQRLPTLTEPRTRGDCAELPRPCPRVSCYWHLHRVDPLGSCVLDEADKGGVSERRIAELLGVPLTTVQHIIAQAIGKIRRRELAEERVREYVAKPYAPPPPPPKVPRKQYRKQLGERDLQAIALYRSEAKRLGRAPRVEEVAEAMGITQPRVALVLRQAHRDGPPLPYWGVRADVGERERILAAAKRLGDGASMAEIAVAAGLEPVRPYTVRVWRALRAAGLR
jgi:lambda repressor-like predicted transcriptional regulator